MTRFVAALVKGTDGAIADPTGATEVMKSVTQYDPTFLDESVPYTLELMTPAAGTKTGCIDVAAWQSYGDWMQTNDLITVDAGRGGDRDRRVHALQLFLTAGPRGGRPASPRPSLTGSTVLAYKI